MTSRGSVASVLGKLALLLVASVTSLLLMEFLLRAALDEVNFLKPRLMYDEVLGHCVEPGSAGHDALGFRNARVPERTEILAIGDSQTYGVSAMAMNAWPAWLSRISERSVYSMALGGYGPIQYEYLLEKYGLAMQPDVVVVGLYFGNDLFDAHRVVYGLEAWAHLRLPDSGLEPETYKSVDEKPAGSLPAQIRLWFSRSSILYRLAVTTAGQFLGRLEMKVRDLPPGVVNLKTDDFETGFTPVRRLAAVDLESEKIEAGLRLTLDALDRIHVLCEASGIRLVVLIVPTKESVYGPWLEDRPEIGHADATARLLAVETELRTRVAEHMGARGVTVVDPIPAMRARVPVEPIYPSNEGGHPVSAGYRAIAEAVAGEL